MNGDYPTTPNLPGKFVNIPDELPCCGTEVVFLFHAHFSEREYIRSCPKCLKVWNIIIEQKDECLDITTDLLDP